MSKIYLKVICYQNVTAYSEEVKIHNLKTFLTTFFTFTAQARAKPTPVLPEVGSMIVVTPGVIFPAFSASSIIRRAIRSLTLPPALKNSHLGKVIIRKHQVKCQDFFS